MSARFDWVAPLFVPGDKPERIVKAGQSAADSVIIDLEDAVPERSKASARSALIAEFTDKPVLVRINAVGTPWREDDVAAVESLQFAAVILPKVESAAALQALKMPLPLIALIETVAGVAAARDITASGRVARLAFGSVDYAADLGCDHVREALAGARSELLVASRLGGLPAPLDGVTMDVRNTCAPQILDPGRTDPVAGPLPSCGMIVA